MVESRRRWVGWLSTLVVIVGACRDANQFVPPPPPQVFVATPLEKPVVDSIEFVGTTESTVTVDLRARVNGYLEKVLFRDGAKVKEGDLLFVIEQAPYQTALDAAKAKVQKASAARQLAESQYKRLAPLVKSGAVTQEELDVQAAQVATSKADVAAAEADVRQAELNLSYTKILSPIDGTIARHEVDVGNLVQAEQTRLAYIRTIDPIYAYFNLSESDLLRFMAMLRENKLPDPMQNPPVLRLGLANEDGFPHEGRLDYREPTLDPATGTTTRRAIFPNPDGQLLPGMFVRLQATIGQPVPRLLVDERALGADQRGDFLLVVGDKNIVEYRPVKLGMHVGKLRVIEEGIRASDRVIVNGLQRARPGAEVRPEVTTMAAEELQIAETQPPELASAANQADGSAAKKPEGGEQSTASAATAADPASKHSPESDAAQPDASAQPDKASGE
jgi:RND family efflux transporter MFP subunit